MHNQLGHCGFVTITGRPNVGKSTLLNHIIGQKLSITSRKPQTTRTRISGIKNDNDSQIIFVDTPGLQKKPGSVFNRYMNRQVLNALSHIDVVIHVIEALKWNEADENVLNHIKKFQNTKLLVINKIDLIRDKSELLPFISTMNRSSDYSEVIPVSAKTGQNLKLLEEQIKKYLSPGQPLYPGDQITDRSERFFAAEFIREKLTRNLGDEIPYNLAVVIDKYAEEKNLIRIAATIWVASDGQKKIVVGKNGDVLKKAGEQARRDMEKMFGKKVFLQTWVKVKNKWTSNLNTLKELGFTS